MPLLGCGSGRCHHNNGAGNRKRVKQTVQAGLLPSLGITFCTMPAVQGFAEPILRLFDSNPAVLQEGTRYLRICCFINCLIYAAMYTFDSFATGIGDSLFAMGNALLHSVVMRLFFSWLLGTALQHGFVGIYWSEMLPFITGALYFYSGVWKKRALLNPEFIMIPPAKRQTGGWDDEDLSSRLAQ